MSEYMHNEPYSDLISETSFCVVVHPEGPVLTMDTGQELLEHIEFLMNNGKQNFVVDFSKIVELESTHVVEILCRGLTRLRQVGGDLKIAQIHNLRGEVLSTKLKATFYPLRIYPRRPRVL